MFPCHPVLVSVEGGYRVAKTHKMPYLYRSVSAEEPYTEWLFGGK